MGFKLVSGEDVAISEPGFQIILSTNPLEFELHCKTEDHIANSTEKCRGCGKVFPAFIGCFDSIGYPIEFYEHCFVRCYQYKRLELIIKCNECEYSYLYINETALKRHKERDHRVHKQFVLSVVEQPEPMEVGHWEESESNDTDNEETAVGRGRRAKRVRKNTANCPAADRTEPYKCNGCWKLFHLKDKKAYSNYTQHCLSCAEYKQLALIHTCLECNIQFLTKSLLVEHERSVHGKKRSTSSRPLQEKSEAPVILFATEVHVTKIQPGQERQVVVVQSAMLPHDSQIKCFGCEKMFPAHVIPEQRKVGYLKHYTLEYYQHILACKLYNETRKLKNANFKMMFVNMQFRSRPDSEL